MACALDLNHVAVGSRGIEPLQVGIEILSAPARSAQLGFTFLAGSVTGVVNTPAAVNIWERASNAACSGGRSAVSTAQE
jgi:hypothetical protein